MSANLITANLITIEEKFEGQICEISLNTPPANILSAKMMEEIATALKEQERKAIRKLIVFSGTGSHFSYGASIEEHTPENVGQMLPAFHRMIGRILECPIPTLAKVSGLCLGGGFELALSCSFLFAEESAKFAVPEIQLGVFPPVAVSLLPSLCGSIRAAQIILSGEKFAAKELQSFGLVNRTAEANQLGEVVQAFIEKQILPKSASSLRIAHRATRAYTVEHYRKTIGALEKLYLDELMSTRDAVEGIRSFMEKRPPRWMNA